MKTFAVMYHGFGKNDVEYIKAEKWEVNLSSRHLKFYDDEGNQVAMFADWIWVKESNQGR